MLVMVAVFSGGCAFIELEGDLLELWSPKYSTSWYSRKFREDLVNYQNVQEDVFFFVLSHIFEVDNFDEAKRLVDS